MIPNEQSEYGDRRDEKSDQCGPVNEGGDPPPYDLGCWTCIEKNPNYLGVKQSRFDRANERPDEFAAAFQVCYDIAEKESVRCGLDEGRSDDIAGKVAIMAAVYCIDLPRNVWGPYTKCVTRHEIGEESDKERRRPGPLPPDDLLGRDEPDLHDVLADEWDAGVNWAEANRRLNRLTPKQKDALRLDCRGISREEIAKQLKTTPSYVTRLIYLANKALREQRRSD